MGAFRRLTRPARHALAYAALRGLVAVLRHLPLGLSLATGALLGRLAGRLALRDTARMRRQLGASLPGGPSTDACWGDLGRRAAELANARRLLPRFDLADEDAARLRAALDSGEGLLAATAHVGNWELMGAALAARGAPVCSLAAGVQGGPLFRWLAAERRALGVRVLAPPGGGRAATAVLRAGGAVAVFVDQATRERSRPLSFFGRPAPTPLTLERLGALTGARVLLIWSARGVRGRHRVHVEAVEGGEDLLERITARLEAIIRAHPAQWVWLHDRWSEHKQTAYHPVGHGRETLLR